MKILWISRHTPTPRQKEELNRHFPGHQLLPGGDTFADAADIMSRIKAAGADEVVVVAPLNVVRALTRRGLRPIWAEMQQLTANADGTPPADAEVTLQYRAGPRHYRHVQFHYITGIEIKLEPLTAPTTEGAA